MNEQYTSTLQTFDLLDEMSKYRKLTDLESLQLEHAQTTLLNAPRTHGLRKELTRRGIKKRATELNPCGS